MFRPHFLLPCLLLALLCVPLSAQENDKNDKKGVPSALAGHLERYEAIVSAQDTFAKVTGNLPETSAPFVAFFSGTELRGAIVAASAAPSAPLQEFYFDQGKLFFAFRRVPGPAPESPAVETRFYFGPDNALVALHTGGKFADPLPSGPDNPAVEISRQAEILIRRAQELRSTATPPAAPASSSESPAPPASEKYIVDGGVTLRSAPGPKKSVVRSNIEDGTVLQVTEQLPSGWFKVKLEDGAEGYVWSKQLKKAEN